MATAVRCSVASSAADGQPPVGGHGPDSAQYSGRVARIRLVISALAPPTLQRKLAGTWLTGYGA